MAARKPRIEYYWSANPWVDGRIDPKVNWRLVGANGEIMCQSTQGFRDKIDAHRGTLAVAAVFCGDIDKVRQVGPGRKPA